MTNQKILVLGTALLALAPSAQAALQGRDLDPNSVGVEAYYDDVLNITWLADANYAGTKAGGVGGAMSFVDATSFVSSVNAQGGVYGFNDWRMPTTAPVNGSVSTWRYQDASAQSGNVNATWAYDGSTDQGTGGRQQSNELGYMYFENLSLVAHYYGPNRRTNQNPAWGIDSPGATYQSAFDGGVDLTANGVTIKNWRHNDFYWTSVELQNEPNYGPAAWEFWTEGSQLIGETNYSTAYVWLVRDGDVISSVPEPESYALMMAGLLVVGVQARRGRRAVADV